MTLVKQLLCLLVIRYNIYGTLCGYYLSKAWVV